MHFASDVMYITFFGALHEGRKNSEDVFFMSLRYLFVDWTEVSTCQVKDSYFNLNWVTRDVTTAVGEDMEVPEMIPISAKEKDGHLKNKEKYLAFARECKHLELLAEHEVIVSGQGVILEDVVQKRAGRTKKTWRRAINLMDVAAYFLRGFSGMPKFATFTGILRCHCDIVTVLHEAACILRKMIAVRDIRHIHAPDGNKEETGTPVDNITETQPSYGYKSVEEEFVEKEREKEHLEQLWKLFLRYETKKTTEGKLWRVTSTVPIDLFKSEHLGSDIDDESEDGAEQPSEKKDWIRKAKNMEEEDYGF